MFTTDSEGDVAVLDERIALQDFGPRAIRAVNGIRS